MYRGMTFTQLRMVTRVIANLFNAIVFRAHVHIYGFLDYSMVDEDTRLALSPPSSMMVSLAHSLQNSRGNTCELKNTR